MMTTKRTKAGMASMARRLTTLAAAAALAGLMSGCATLQHVEPDSAGIELGHTSHVTQHPPFAELAGRQPTNFGYDVLGLYGHWSDGPVWLQITEGYSLLSGWQTIPGPREIFQAQLGVRLWKKR